MDLEKGSPTEPGSGPPPEPQIDARLWGADAASSAEPASATPPETSPIPPVEPLAAPAQAPGVEVVAISPAEGVAAAATAPQVSTPSAASPAVRPQPLERLWSVQLPHALDPWLPQAADALVDGVWTAAWPRLAEFAPLIAFAVAFFAPRLWPGITQIYSESLLFVALVIAASILSGSSGLMILCGYILGDLLFGAARRFGFPDSLVGRYLGQVVAYLLLAQPTFLFPLLAKQFVRQIRINLGDDPTLRLLMRAGLTAAAFALLIYLWSQGIVVLIRPLFTWLNQSPPIEAIQPIQTQWQLLVLVAVVAGFARVVLEEILAPRQPRTAVVKALREERRTTIHPQRGALWQRLPLPVHIGLAALAATLLLAGSYENALDAALVALVTAGLGAWRAGLIGRMPSVWTAAILKIPALLRFGAALLIGNILANAMLGVLWTSPLFQSGSLRPVMVAALTTLVVFYLLFPRQPAIRAGAQPQA